MFPCSFVGENDGTLIGYCEGRRMYVPLAISAWKQKDFP